MNDVEIVPVQVMHDRLPILGYRMGDLAYITDAKTIDREEREKLQNLEVLVVNALRIKPHHSHFNLDEALQLVAYLRPKQAYFTHISTICECQKKC